MLPNPAGSQNYLGKQKSDYANISAQNLLIAVYLTLSKCQDQHNCGLGPTPSGLPFLLLDLISCYCPSYSLP